MPLLNPNNRNHRIALAILGVIVMGLVFGLGMFWFADSSRDGAIVQGFFFGVVVAAFQVITQNRQAKREAHDRPSPGER